MVFIVKLNRIYVLPEPMYKQVDTHTNKPEAHFMNIFMTG
jgi:hypothetical protein